MQVISKVDDEMDAIISEMKKMSTSESQSSSESQPGASFFFFFCTTLKP